MFVRLRRCIPGDAFSSTVTPEWSPDTPPLLRELTGQATLELIWVAVDGVPVKDDQQPVAVKLSFRRREITIWSYALRTMERRDEGFVLYFAEEQVVG